MKKLIYIAGLFALTFLVSCGPDPEKSRMYFNEGLDFHYASKFNNAIECFQKAIEVDENNYEAYYYLGCSYFNIGKRDEAKNCWLKSIEIKQDFADGYFNIGQLYKINNDHEMACYYFKQAEKYGRSGVEDFTRFCN